MSAGGHNRGAVRGGVRASEEAREGLRPLSGHSGAVDLLWAAVAAGVVWCLMSVTAAAALLAGVSAGQVPAAGHVEVSPPREPISARQLPPEPAASGAKGSGLGGDRSQDSAIAKGVPTGE